MKVSEHEYYNWYVLFTAFHAEKKVKRQLDAAGIGSYLPFKISRFQWQNIKKEMSVPAVARCIFVYIFPTET